MSERNIELHRRFDEAFNARDIEAMIALCDPSIEFHDVAGAVDATVYHGHDGIRSWHQAREEIAGEICVEPEAYFDLGQDTLVFHVLHGRGKQSGVEVAMLIATVAKWREDLMVYANAYADREAALRDLGVSKDELEPIAP